MMRPLSASELLSLWERESTRSPVQWAMALLDTANPDMSVEEIARLSIGQRNGLLMRLREWTFGAQLTSVATCARCRERLELHVNVADLLVAPDAEPSADLSLSAEGLDVRFRLPDSVDLMAIVGLSDVATAQHVLLKRCIVSVYGDGAAQASDALPAHIVAMIAERMEQADPQANIQLALACPVCSHEWYETFDIVTYFWNEINAWAQGVLRDVHILASAYGWRESDVLALSPWRRQFYLDMVTR